jgi:hypothetical protein
MLPERDGNYYLEEIIAIEVKILRLPVRNRNLHVRPSGREQARGLVRDGFPFAGILHIIIPEASPVEQWKPMSQYKFTNDNFEVESIPGIFSTDAIGAEVAERHFGRMKRYVEGTCIGAKAVSLVLDDSGRKILGRDISNREISPMRNSSVDRELLKRFCRLAAAVKATRGRHSP